MLVLARYANETIHIGDDIEVVVVEVLGPRVRLGIKAPTNIEVHRHEVFLERQDRKDRKQAEGEE